MAKSPFGLTPVEMNRTTGGVEITYPDDMFVPIGVLRQFGYSRLIERLPDELELRGRLRSRPTLVVVAQPPGGLPLAHSAAYYDNFFFNTSEPYTFAWVMNDYGAPPVRVLNGTPPIINLSEAVAQLDMGPRAAAILRMLIDNGTLASLQELDDLGKNDDVLTTVEILIVIVDTYSTEIAATRSTSLDIGSFKINAEVVFMGHQASLMTACHEVFHQWGAIDLYGANFTTNTFLTLMAATVFGIPDDIRTVELDPWHRMQFGVTAPKVIDFATQGTGSVNIQPVAKGRENSALLFWDSRQDKSDYFIVELRAPIPGTVDSDVIEGFVIWTVHTDAQGNPESPGNGIPGVASFGADLRAGSSVLWQGGMQTPVLPWSNGNSSALSLSFNRSERDNGTISWTTVSIRPPPEDVPEEWPMRSPIVR